MLVQTVCVLMQTLYTARGGFTAEFDLSLETSVVIHVSDSFPALLHGKQEMSYLKSGEYWDYVGVR